MLLVFSFHISLLIPLVFAKVRISEENTKYICKKKEPHGLPMWERFIPNMGMFCSQRGNTMVPKAGIICSHTGNLIRDSCRFGKNVEFIARPNIIFWKSPCLKGFWAEACSVPVNSIPINITTKQRLSHTDTILKKELTLEAEFLSLYINRICYYTLISTSTPLGSSSFIRASTVLAVEL